VGRQASRMSILLPAAAGVRDGANAANMPNAAIESCETGPRSGNSDLLGLAVPVRRLDLMTPPIAWIRLS